MEVLRVKVLRLVSKHKFGLEVAVERVKQTALLTGFSTSLLVLMYIKKINMDV